ncbi:hypothetical protein MYX04_01275 [Nitrospiraceae bacterium AH_259_D15_M11_P09]|nr:hypothetical protein [Nitrospiraceae bacterium AH_259_D15_M11_P09]
MINKDNTSHIDSAVIHAFKDWGYYPHRGLFERDIVEAACAWLKDKNPDLLSKSWTEKEPGVPLAVFSAIHKGHHPVAAIATDKRVLEIAADLMGAPVYIWATKVT